MKLNIRNGVTVINGQTFKGSCIQVSNGRVIVDGVEHGVESGPSIDVEIHGDVQSLELESGTVRANYAGSVKTVSGDVTCGEVGGSIKTVSGDVNTGAVAGSVSTVSGDIQHLKPLL